MIIEPIVVRDRLARITEHWRPEVIARLNGQEVKLVKFKGAFVWHRHEAEDELFLCVDGTFRIEFRDRVVVLAPGACLVVPRGVEHRPVADEEASALLFEPAGVRNTGDVEHPTLTAPSHVLDTERLRLRRLCSDDAAFIVELLNDPSFIENIGDRKVRTLDDARAYIANGPVAMYERFGFGLFLVALKETGTPIGICGLLKRETLNDIDIGFAFLPAHWSRGYAIESAMGVKAWATAELGVKRLVAIVLPANTSSIRLLEKMDFRAETTIRLTDCGDELLLYGCALD
jgi:RimJ/RimL family protein N-acetyltransferase